MGTRKTPFSEDCFYHVYNRGVEKRDIFLDENDYGRFLYLLFWCNDTKPLLNSQVNYRGLASIQDVSMKEIRKKDKLVDIIAFCLMPNHFHLVLRQTKDKGIPMFMQKLGTGYAMYFNFKRKRNGALFQGPFKAIYIDEQKYLDHIITYVHLNPADLVEPKWKENGIRNWQRTYNFVKEYTWSSYSNYFGGGRFENILSVSVIKGLFDCLSDNKIARGFINRGVDYLKDYVIETL